MITLKFSTDGITVEIDIQDRLCILRDVSGKGKTLLFKLLTRYGEFVKKDYVFFRNDGASKIGLPVALRTLGEDAIIMIDDGIIYDDSLSKSIVESRACVICDIKSYGEFPAKYRKVYGRYDVIVTKDSIKLRRLGGENII